MYFFLIYDFTKSDRGVSPVLSPCTISPDFLWAVASDVYYRLAQTADVEGALSANATLTVAQTSDLEGAVSSHAS